MAKLFGFNEQDAAILKRVAADNAIRRGGVVTGGSPVSFLAGGAAVGAWVMQATTTITGATYSTNTTPGSGTAKLMFRGTSYLEAYYPDTNIVTETAYSLWPFALPSGSNFLAMRTCDGDLWAMSWLNPPQLFARFTLDEPLDTTDEYVTATLQNQYGLGAHTTVDVIVYNLAKGSSGYVFEGATGAAGLAIYSADGIWRIIQMECPAA